MYLIPTLIGSITEASNILDAHSDKKPRNIWVCEDTCLMN